MYLRGSSPPPGYCDSPAGGDVRVLGEEQRLVAALLGQARDLAGADRVVGGEVADSEFHPGESRPGRRRRSGPGAGGGQARKYSAGVIPVSRRNAATNALGDS